jgi:hypothetical protein
MAFAVVCSGQMHQKTAIHYEAFEDKQFAPDWRVEAVDDESEGEVYVTIFSGPRARERAEEYASWKNQSQTTNPAKTSSMG